MTDSVNGHLIHGRLAQRRIVRKFRSLFRHMTPHPKTLKHGRLVLEFRLIIRHMTPHPIRRGVIGRGVLGWGIQVKEMEGNESKWNEMKHKERKGKGRRRGWEMGWGMNARNSYKVFLGNTFYSNASAAVKPSVLTADLLEAARASPARAAPARAASK